jgi:hypothetical protein
MVSNVARLTSALRNSVLEEDADLPLSPEIALSEKIDAVRRDLAETGVAFFTDARGHRFRIVRKPA